MDEVLRYRSVLASNREVFLIENAAFVRACSAADDNFATLIEPLGTMRDAERHSHVSLIPFVHILQRQCRAAFEAFSVFQSYQAWLVLRPGIEAVLIIGKWIDDPAAAKIWKNRRDDWKAYQAAYSGKALRSKRLTMSDLIQGVLSKLNDDFVHANPDYYHRHLKVDAADSPGDVDLRLECFDDGVIHEASVLAFLHLLLVMQEGLAGLLSALFSKPLTLTSTSKAFGSVFGGRIKKLSSDSPEAAGILREFGLLEI
jgi:hypothetical protein